MREIQLTQGKVALVDNCDYDVLRQYNWHARRLPFTFYAKRNVPKPGGGQKTEYMHGIILAEKLGRPIAPRMMPDHIDGNGLNNQRENLEEKSSRGNNENKHVAKTSQYLGVSWNKVNRKWEAGIRVAGKQIYLGYHATEIEAALAREAYINAHPELGARSNFLEESCC